LSPDHKAALAAGRVEARHVGAYIDAMAANRAGGGRRRTAQTVRRELKELEADLSVATGVKRLELVARRLELKSELDARTHAPDLEELRRNFIKYAGSYARRKAIPKQAFIEVGIPAADVAAAKIS
jgi:hypothetical protein